MAVGIPMVLSEGICGMTFAGADVGGFFGNPEPEMLVRWYQVGIFSPFFRAHAHIDTKRREPYLLDEPYKSMARNLIRLRYSMLPVWYTAFRQANAEGMPILRPQYVMFPKNPKGFSLGDQYYIGNSGLLVKPVTSPGVTETQVYLAEDEAYYDYFTNQIFHGSSAGKTVTVHTPLEKPPVLLRGGSIVPTRERPRRSSPLMKQDPFTLRITLSKSGSARGELYMDDGETYSHQQGQVVWREFRFSRRGRKENWLTSTDLVASGKVVADGFDISRYSPLNAFAKSVEGVRVEKIIILGLPMKPRRVEVSGVSKIEHTWQDGSSVEKEGTASVLTLKNPGVQVTQDWAIVFTV
jgi:alpha 1,3-glucosidase